jgi:hypothetical protein
MPDTLSIGKTSVNGILAVMYAAAYVRPEGFGSVGFLADISRGRTLVADPIFGSTWVAPEDFFCVIETEGGATLPGVSPALVQSPFSEHLVTEEALAANRAEVVMLEAREGGGEFPSGYPIAWEYIRRWREGVAVDWRTVALSAIFARNSIQRSIEEAEMLFRIFGPTIRDALVRGKPPTAKQLQRFKGIANTRAVRRLQKGKRKGEYSWDDIPAYVSIFEWAPWVAEQANASPSYDRSFRDMVAIEWLPRGIGLAKLSFTMMLMGRDAACLDTRMQRYFFGQYDEQEEDASFDVAELDALAKQEEEEFYKGVRAKEPERARWMDKTKARSTAKGARGATRTALNAYVEMEDRLGATPYFDPDWFMPFAKAQWMLWETLGRTAGTANHSALWEVITPLIEDIDAGRL